MIDSKKSNSNTDFNITKTDIDFADTLLHLNVYKELDENPNQNLDLVTHIKNQLQQLELIHKRKMFMIKEIAAVHLK